MPAEPTPFEQLGAARLRALIDDFIARVFADVMIGFHFRAADLARVQEKEYELAARHLGAEVPYTGRPLPEAHAPHPILDGQFTRRLKLLEETLADHGVPPDVAERLLRVNEALRAQVVAGDCAPPRPRMRRL